MAISVSDNMKEIIQKRQKTKYEAIRKTPIFDREFTIPIRQVQIRCLEYIPKKTKGTLPVVFDFHGGGFTNGYPEEDDFLCRYICDQLQIRVFSVDYRLAPEFPYPEGQLDAFESINYFYANASQYQIDVNQMIVLGHSAGANHALVSAMRALLQNKYQFKGIILDYPPLDIATPADDKFFIEGAIPKELSDTFNACYRLPEQANEPYCSPIFASDETLKQLPPVTILSCEIDSLRAEEDAFAQRLIENGVEVIQRRFLGQKHAFTIEYDNPASMQAIVFLTESVKRYLEKRD